MKRIKLILLFGSLGFMVFLNLYKNNFYKKVTINKWRQLEWNDFQGTKRPFTMYGAGILSDIYLDLDSLGKYYAYAGQNNQISWKKKSSEDWEYGLNHEQYHFNITEIFARRMNEFIEQNPDPETNSYGEQLKDYKRELRIMQNNYDDETDHSLNRGPQRLWEYRIDSMLIAHSDKQEYLIDYYSGASIPTMFQKGFDLDKGVEDDRAFRTLSAKKYDLDIYVISRQNALLNPLDYLRNELNENFESLTDFDIKPIKINDSRDEYIRTWRITHIKNNSTGLQSWSYNGSYMYTLNIFYDFNDKDSTYYSMIAKSIIRSFTTSVKPDYWLKKADQFLAIEVNETKDINDKFIKDCMVFKEIEPVGVHTNQFNIKSDKVIIPFQITKVADSLISAGVLLVGESTFLSEVSSDEHIFKIPAEEFPKQLTRGYIGYILKSDSSAGCFQFYGQPIAVGGSGR